MRMLLVFSALLLLVGCVMSDKEKEDFQARIQTLEKQNQSLNTYNQKMKASREQLREQVLQSLVAIKKHFDRLIQDNIDLYQKLYKERIEEQKKLLEEKQKYFQDWEKEVLVFVEKDQEKEIVTDKEKMKKMLMQKRQKLVDMNAWTIKDERSFTEINKKLKENLSPEEEKKAMEEAYEIHEGMTKRIEQK